MGFEVRIVSVLLLAVVLVAVLIAQVRRAEVNIEKSVRIGSFSLVADGIVIPGVFFALLVGVIFQENVLSFLPGWVICAVVAVEVATFGRPIKLARWIDIFEEKRTMSRRADGDEFTELAEAQRPYRRYFWAWIGTLPISFIGALFIGFAVALTPPGL